MISQVNIDKNLRLIPVGEPLILWGVPVTKIIKTDPSDYCVQCYLYVIGDHPKPLRIGSAILRMAELLKDYDDEE